MKTNDYQIPLRLNDTLRDALDEASHATGINKSKLCRMGISRLISDLNATGRTESMQRFRDHYKELDTAEVTQ